MAVEYDEGVVVLERAAGPRRRSRHRNVEWRFRNVLGGMTGNQLSDFGCHLDLEAIFSRCDQRTGTQTLLPQIRPHG